jgi:hypothetical protein
LHARKLIKKINLCIWTKAFKTEEGRKKKKTSREERP